MQPYFFPYAGYYRLLAAADTFVVFDDVQFPRRGRVHRCELFGPSGETRWLTLPLAHSPRDTAIRSLRFANGARESFDERLARLAWLRDARGPLAPALRARLAGPLDDPCGFVTDGLRFVSEALGLRARILRASDLAIAHAGDRTSRIVALVRALGGTHYLNAPGGRALYDRTAFEESGMALRFLAPFVGSRESVLRALATREPEDLRAEIVRDLELLE